MITSQILTRHTSSHISEERHRISHNPSYDIFIFCDTILFPFASLRESVCLLKFGLQWGYIGLLGSCLIAYDGPSLMASQRVLLQKAPSWTLHQPQAPKRYRELFLSCLPAGFIVWLWFSSVDLAAVKKITLGAASLVWFFSNEHHGSVVEDGSTLSISAMSLEEQLSAVGLSGRSLWSWLLIIYSALGPGALATYLQTAGQSVVLATTAQVIFSLTPLWTALLAQLAFNGGEAMGPLSWAGGSAVLLANVTSQAQASARSSKKGRT